MRNLRGSRVLAAVIVVLLLGAVYGLAGLRHSMSLSAGPATRAPRLATVSSVQRVCPAPGATTSPAGGIAVMSSPAAGGSGQAGAALNVTRLTGTGPCSTTWLVAVTKGNATLDKLPGLESHDSGESDGDG